MRLGRGLVVGLAIGVLAVAGGCGGGGGTTTTTKTQTKAAAPPSQEAAQALGVSGRKGTCVSVPADLDRVLLKHVVLASARLRKVLASRAVGTTGDYYVSAAVSGSGTNHLLATWVTSDLHGHKPIYSVDANAALVSVYGAASQASPALGIDAPGAYRSRQCVDGKRAAQGAPAPSSGGGAPAGQ